MLLSPPTAASDVINTHRLIQDIYIICNSGFEIKMEIDWGGVKSETAYTGTVLKEGNVSALP
jgi:hypothetical protein